MNEIEKKEILVAFGEHLKTVRTKKDISLRKLELLCEVDHSQIHKIEKGLSAPSLITLILLSKGLGVSLKKLIEF